MSTFDEMLTSGWRRVREEEIRLARRSHEPGLQLAIQSVRRVQAVYERELQYWGITPEPVFDKDVE